MAEDSVRSTRSRDRANPDAGLTTKGKRSKDAQKAGGAPSSASSWAPKQRTFLGDEWKVVATRFESPLVRHLAQQTVLFNQSLKDGTIGAEITLMKSLGQRWKGKGEVQAGLVFRYAAEDRYYYAGTGAWDAKYHISKAIPGPYWLRLGSVGSADSLKLQHPYRLRVECQGTKIVLFDNDTVVLEAIDDDYTTGRWGLTTFRTQARFEPEPPDVSPRKCFVIMPFAPVFDGVYRVIQRVVESYENVECKRADELTLSRPIMEDVRNEIARADLVIVDLTGRNSNVYYEAGMAAAWNKDWIVIAQSNDDLTFDVEQIRTILYANRIGGDAALEERLHEAVRATLGLPAARR
jgi:hypothetical protein